MVPTMLKFFFFFKFIFMKSRLLFLGQKKKHLEYIIIVILDTIFSKNIVVL